MANAKHIFSALFFSFVINLRFVEVQALIVGTCPSFYSTSSSAVLLPGNKHHRWQLLTNNLEEVLLDPKIADKPIALVAIAGPYRRGKSFFMNFLHRYLKWKANASDGMDWLDSECMLKEQFSWKGGSQRHTQGIRISSEPILMKRPDGEEIAVLLMDTQGTFDPVSDNKDNTIIFSLSTLVSSMLIYNIGHAIASSDLEHLQFFGKYAELAHREENATTAEAPFQELIFLVRDWQLTQHYGFEEGQTHLDEHLKPRDHDSKALMTLRQDIRQKLFQSVRAFLMPHPGPVVSGASRQKSFTGNLTDIDSTFLEQIREFVTVLSPEHIRTKKIFGIEVTASGLYLYFRNFFNKFDDPSLPEPRSVYDAMTETSQQIAVTNALKRYEVGMQEIVLANSSTAIPTERLVASDAKFRAIAVESFKNASKLGDSTITNRSLIFLAEKFESLYQRFSAINAEKAALQQLAEQERNSEKRIQEMEGNFQMLRNDHTKTKEELEQAIQELNDARKEHEAEKLVREQERADAEARLSKTMKELEDVKNKFWQSFFEELGRSLPPVFIAIPL